MNINLAPLVFDKINLLGGFFGYIDHPKAMVIVNRKQQLVSNGNKFGNTTAILQCKRPQFLQLQKMRE